MTISKNGQVLRTPKTMAIYWGSGWNDPDTAGDIITGMDSFFTGLSGSHFAEIASEYGDQQRFDLIAVDLSRSRPRLHRAAGGRAVQQRGGGRGVQGRQQHAGSERGVFRLHVDASDVAGHMRDPGVGHVRRAAVADPGGLYAVHDGHGPAVPGRRSIRATTAA